MSSQNHNSDYFYYDSNSPSAHNHQMEIQKTVYGKNVLDLKVKRVLCLIFQIDYNNLPTNFMSFAHSQHSAFRPLDSQYSLQNFDPEYQMQISDNTYGF